MIPVEITKILATQQYTIFQTNYYTTISWGALQKKKEKYIGRYSVSVLPTGIKTTCTLESKSMLSNDGNNSSLRYTSLYHRQ